MHRDKYPRLFDVRVVNLDGSTYLVKSTLDLGIIKLNEESKNLPIWKRSSIDPALRDKTGNIAMFKEKYGDLGDLFGEGDVPFIPPPPPPPPPPPDLNLTPEEAILAKYELNSPDYYKAMRELNGEKENEQKKKKKKK